MKRAYSNHQYCGRRVNAKRSRAAFQWHSGNAINRADAWRANSEVQITQKSEDSEQGMLPITSKAVQRNEIVIQKSEPQLVKNNEASSGKDPEQEMVLKTYKPVHRCDMCGKTWHESSDRDKKINKSFVWGSLTAASHFSQASHILAIMDVPDMSADKFKKLEIKLGSIWDEHLWTEMTDTAAREKDIAIEKGHVCADSVPYITVYVDGRWCKRSYGHNFNASSGIIQGQLRVARRKTCYLIIFTEIGAPIKIITVIKDDEFILDMVAKLVWFYKSAILPEIILRRCPLTKNVKNLAELRLINK